MEYDASHYEQESLLAIASETPDGHRKAPDPKVAHVFAMLAVAAQLKELSDKFVDLE